MIKSLLMTFILLCLGTISVSGQHDFGSLIPEETATHTAINDGSWFDMNTWSSGTIPGEGAVVYIPMGKSVSYQGQSTAHIFAIRVDGTFTCLQSNTNETTTLIFDTLFGNHMSKTLFWASNISDGKIDITIKPFDIEAYKASGAAGWNTNTISHFSDGMPTDKVVRTATGGSRYNSYEEAIAGDTAITEESREPMEDGPGVLGRYNWDPQQLSLGIVTLGEIEILGQQKTNMIKLSADAMRGQKNVSLQSIPEGWAVGDSILITRGGNKNPTANGEDEALIASLVGSTITTAKNLKKNHEGRPQDNLHCYVGNLTRNITIRSAIKNVIHQRGHLMAMHNDKNIKIKNASFVDMGRTDKSRLLDDLIWDKWVEPKVFKSKMSALGQECSQMKDAPPEDITNRRGRYSIHIHRTGARFNANMVQVTGNVVWGNPGWGITHHDSHANVSENVVYDVIGSGIVSEAGSETGFWDNNLVAKITSGHSTSPYKAALFHDDYLYSGQGLGMKGRAVVCRGNVIANTIQGVGIMNMNPTTNNVVRVDPKQLATVRPGFEVDQFPLSVNGYSKEGDDVLPVEVALILENTTIIGANIGLKSIERDMGVNHESRSVFDGLYIWGINQGLSITYQADYTFHDVFISGKNDTGLGAYLWKHSHNHVFDGIKMADLAHGITVSKLVESGNGNLKTRNNGFTPWYFIDLELENVGEFYEIIKEDPSTTTSYTEHSDNPIHAKKTDFVSRPTTFTLDTDADLVVDYAAADFKFEIDGMITDDLGSYNFGIRQALAQGTLRNGYPERIYEFASKVKFDEYLMQNGVYEHPYENYLYFILHEKLPNRLTSKYTDFPLRIRIENPPSSGAFAAPLQEPLSNFVTDQLVSLSASVSQSSTATTITYDGFPIDCGPQKAIDKNTNGRINAQIYQRGLVPLGSFSQTETENEPWYDLDLGESKTIKFIDVWNTVELNGTSIETMSPHFTNFYVLISETPFEDMDLTTARQNADYEYLNNAEPSRKFSLNNLNIEGRYIRIQAMGNTSMKLAEVEIIASTAPCVQDIVAPTAMTKDITLELNETGEVHLAAADIDNGSIDNCFLATMEIDIETFTCAQLGDNIVTLSVTDGSGLSNTATATVTIIDIIKPTILTQNISIQLNAEGSATIKAADIDAGATDNCEITALTLDVATFDCTSLRTQTVTLTATDASGNSSSETAIVTITDGIKPVVVTKDITVQLNVNGIANITAQDIDAGSTDNCEIIELTVDRNTFDCTSIGTQIVTLTATDTGGNSNSSSATVVIKDLDPIIDCPTEAIVEVLDTAEVFEIPDYSYLVRKGCDENTITVVQTPEVGTLIKKALTTQISIQVTDVSGNQSNCTFELTIVTTPESEAVDNEFIQIFPNPAVDEIEIQTDGENISAVEIYDYRGRMVKKVVFQNKNQDSYKISLVALETGVYFIKIQLENRSILKRVIKL